MEKLLHKIEVAKDIGPREFVAVKLHFGDKDNETCVPPEALCPVIEHFQAKDAHVFLTETATLYKGVRMNAVVHLKHAIEQGFTYEKLGAPIICADGLSGDSEVAVEIPGKLFEEVFIAREARMADFIFVLSHMTGHMLTGFGGTIKNLGMGLASRKGKMRQHSSMSPKVKKENCTLCKKCFDWCPVEAISQEGNVASIDEHTCIGCGECLSVCRFDAIAYDWAADGKWMSRAMAEHALGAVYHKRAFYMMDCCSMTQQCDCVPFSQEKLIPDLGVLASWDPVALDQAALELTKKEKGKDLSQLAFPDVDGELQIVHAEEIGLGNRTYELIEVE